MLVVMVITPVALAIIQFTDLSPCMGGKPPFREGGRLPEKVSERRFCSIKWELLFSSTPMSPFCRIGAACSGGGGGSWRRNTSRREGLGELLILGIGDWSKWCGLVIHQTMDIKICKVCVCDIHWILSMSWSWLRKIGSICCCWWLVAWWTPSLMTSFGGLRSCISPPQHTALSPSNAHCAAFRQCVTMYYLCTLLLVIEPWIGALICNSLKQKKFRIDWMGSLGWTRRDITPDKCQKGEKAFWEWSAVILFQKLHPSPFQLVRGIR